MTKIYTKNAYVMTGDEPIQAQTVKRLLLFYNSVLFSDVSDEAIVNEGEVFEQFPNMRVEWSARGHYPRVEGYRERYERFMRGADVAFRKRLIQPIESKAVKCIDPGTHWLCYSASLSDADLAMSAATDASMVKPQCSVPSTIYQGAEIAQGGMRSKYAVEYKAPVDIPNVHEDWKWICRLRVGRALKSVRMAQALNAAPIAVDNVNSRIARVLAEKASPYQYPRDSFLDFVINAEVVDNEKLEILLSDASWDEVLRIRKYILPNVIKTKRHLDAKVNLLSGGNYEGVDSYIRALTELKGELAQLQEQEAEAWEALRIGSVLKGGGVVGAYVLGTVAMPSVLAFPSVIISLVAAGLVSAGALSQELQGLIPARRRVRANPLFVIEKLTQE